MSKKQAAWLRVLVMVILIVIFVLITIRLYVEYGNQIFYMIMGILLIIPSLPIVIWGVIAAFFYALLELAIKSLIKAYEYNPYSDLW